MIMIVIMITTEIAENSGSLTEALPNSSLSTEDVQIRDVLKYIPHSWSGT